MEARTNEGIFINWYHFWIFSRSLRSFRCPWFRRKDHGEGFKELGKSRSLSNVSYGRSFSRRFIDRQNTKHSTDDSWMVFYHWCYFIFRKLVSIRFNGTKVFSDDYSLWWCCLFSWLGLLRLRRSKIYFIKKGRQYKSAFFILDYTPTVSLDY